jgi:transketolase
MSNPNPKQKLNPKLFELTVEQMPIRRGFGEGLLLAGEQDQKVVGLCADLTESTQMHLFKNKFPERFVEIGVAEQNLVTVASGLAAMGKIPFVSSYAMFSPGRNWEQIRTTVCYNNRPVIIAGSHAGVSVGPDGGSHQALEDIAITRVIPRLNVVVPCDALEAKKVTLALAKLGEPAYLRLGREKTPVVTTDQSPLEIGKANVIWLSAEPAVTIIACGTMVYNAILAAKRLAAENIQVTVINLHTIKPIDAETILAEVKKTGAVVTAEEHQAAGGMGSAVAEILAENYPVLVEMVAVRDQFGQSGDPRELMEHYGLGISHIMSAVKKVIARK